MKEVIEGGRVVRWRVFVHCGVFGWQNILTRSGWCGRATNEPEQDRVKRIATLHCQCGAERFELVVAGNERYHIVLHMWLTQSWIEHQETRDESTAAQIVQTHRECRNFDFFQPTHYDLMNSPCLQHHGEENQCKTHVTKPSVRIWRCAVEISKNQKNRLRGELGLCDYGSYGKPKTNMLYHMLAWQIVFVRSKYVIKIRVDPNMQPAIMNIIMSGWEALTNLVCRLTTKMVSAMNVPMK